jgi:magnesium-transporting ATPase (P-type)
MASKHFAFKIDLLRPNPLVTCVVEFVMRFALVILMFALVATGCASDSRTQQQRAYLAGQNAALQQQQALQNPSVIVVGSVQNATVPWVQGLTLAQAVATANYLGQNPPKTITIIRNGESATIDAKLLFQGAVVPLEAGDVVELQ